MARETIRHIFERAGYSGVFSPHGLRSTAATLLREAGFASDLVELQLAHQDRNRTRASYDHAALIEPRRKMLAWWAALLDAEVSRL
jgi:integrase